MEAFHVLSQHEARAQYEQQNLVPSARSEAQVSLPRTS